MGRTWVHEYPDHDELTLEYRPGGTVSLIAHSGYMGTVELVGMPYHVLLEGVGAMQAFQARDEDYEIREYHSIPECPWPGADRWITAWWYEGEGRWCAGHQYATREEAVKKLEKLREASELQWRLVRERSSYFAEEG